MGYREAGVPAPSLARGPRERPGYLALALSVVSATHSLLTCYLYNVVIS